MTTTPALPDTQPFDYQQYLHWTYFDGKAMDAEEFERLSTLLDGVEVFIDIGASHGVYTKHALDHLTDADIVAVEADPERFEILQRNVAAWTADPDSNAATNRVRCISAAVTDAQDLAAGPTATFFTTGTQISGGLFAVGERSDDYAPIEVERVKLDDLWQPGKKTFVKVDVEGGELRVLRGAERMLASGDAVFFVELSWWGDRERGTSAITTLRHLHRQGLGIERRLRSDYLIFAEPSRLRRLTQLARCLPPLLPRWLFATFAPFRLRRAYIRRQNRQRLAAMARWREAASN